MSAKSLAAYLALSTAFIFAVFASPALAQGTLYEGARLITGPAVRSAGNAEFSRDREP